MMTGTLVLLVLLRRQQGRERRKIAQLCHRVEQALAGSDHPSGGEQSLFPCLLREAAHHAGFEKPRLRIQAGVAGDPPEKYRYFRVLQQRGMKAEEIADILGISTDEARQLASLHMAAVKRAA